MNPIVLQTIQLMTSILASEKVDEGIKEYARRVLNNLLPSLDTDAEAYRYRNSNLRVE